MNEKGLPSYGLRWNLLFRPMWLALLVFLLSGLAVQAQTATVTSDKDDYAPRSNAVFTGAGFAPNENVTLKVKNLNRPCNTVSADSSYLPWTVKADASGGFVSNWTVCDCNGDSLRLRATGQTSGRIAYAYFTDAVSITSVLPNSGPTQGGTSVTINGTGFTNGGDPWTVVFGNSSKINATRNSNNLSLSVITPAHVAGEVDVIVYDKNNNYVTLEKGFTYGKLNQIIDFAPLSNKTYGDAPFILNATATSGLTVTYSVLSGPATISGNALTITGAGNVTVRASQAGNNAFNAATDVNQAFTVTPQTIYPTVTVSNKTYDGSTSATIVTRSLSGIVGSDNVSLGTSGTATFDNATAGAGKTVTITGLALSGSTAVNYSLSSTTATATATIDKATATIFLAGLTGQEYNGNPRAVTATTAPAGLTGVTVTYNGSATAPTNADAYNVIASLNNINYQATNATGTLIIGKATTTTVVTIAAGPFTYTGSAHTPATVSVIGAGGLNLVPAAVYANNTNAGVNTASASYTFAETANHLGSTHTVNFTIGKAEATITVAGYTGTYDGNAHGATGSAKGVKNENLAGLSLGSSFTNVPGGTANWTFTDATGNYNDATGTAGVVLDKAEATITVAGYTGTYDGNAHGATGSAKGVKNENLAGLSLGSSFTNVPGGTANWTFTDATGNYNDATGTAGVVLDKAEATITVAGYTGTYDGNAHGATGSAKGVKNENLAGLSLGSSFTNVPGGTANWTFTDATGNYNDATGTAGVVLDKAEATITVAGYTGTYDGNAHGATGSAKGVKNENLAGLSLGSSFTNVPGGTANWTFTDATGNYNDATGTAGVVLDKAEATITVAGYTGTYDGNAHGATGSAKGVKNENLAGLSLGSSFTNVPGGTANWTFTDATGNYNDATGTAGVVLDKAEATITVAGYTGTYDGNAHGATGSAKGVKNENLAGLSLGSSFTNVPGGTANWTFTDATGNYNDATGTAGVVLDKAEATITVAGYTGTYDGNAHGATGSAKGVKNENLAGLSLGSSFTNVPGGTANWTFTDATGNYNDATGTAGVVLDKAEATITVAGYTGTYDGNAHGATGSAKGVKNENLAGLSLGSSFTNVPGGTANWTFTDATGNYNDATGTAGVVLDKAEATITVAGYTGTYDGNAHGATGSAKGVKNENLAGLSLGSSFTNVPGGTANWTFTDATGNYNDATGTAGVVLDKAEATITVAGYTGTYDGNAHGATGSAKGVKNENLAGLSLGSSFTNVPGGTANWTFTDATGNYNDATGTAGVVLDKAEATITVAGYTGTYDGNAHGATGSAKGVKNENLAGLSLGSSFTNVPGGTANWTFTDATGNYNDATGTAGVVLDKAEATITVAGYTGTYDGNAHGATGSAKGVKNENLAGLSLGSSFTNVPGGTANWTFTDATGNYNDATGTAGVVLDKAEATITVAGYTGTYDGNAHGATGSAKGVKNENLAGLSLGSSFTNVPGGTANWTFTDATGNYNDATGTAGVVLDKAEATITVAGYTGTYDGNAHGATGSAKGVKNENLAGLSLGSSFTNVPGGTANWTFTDATGNYNDATGTAGVVLDKAEATITVAGYTGTYDGNAHGATGSAKGVKNENLAGLSLGSSFTNVPGGTANWTFTDATGNYNDATGTAGVVLDKAEATITVAGYTGTYDGNAHGATGSAKGVKNENLAGLSLGSSFTNVPGGTANWTFTDATGNYNDATGTAGVVLDKAEATITVAGYTGTYDGNAHGATGSAKGVKNENLAGLSLGSSFTNVPGGTANWTFTDATGNYNDATGTAGVVLDKAEATITVAGYTGTYDGNAHGATGSAKGVKNENLAGLSLGSSFTNVPGGTANWTFTDATGNYNDATGTAGVVLDKAEATITVAGYTGTYDGNAHGATGSAKGVKNENLAGLSLGSSFTNVPGGTANWTFTDATGNYNDATGTAGVVLDKAEATITVAGYTGTYDGNAHGATGSAKGVKNENLAGLSLGSSFTNVPGGTANWTFTDATGNYNDATGTAGVVLDKAEATITVAGYTGTYDGNAHGATGSAKGVKNENLAGLSLGSSFTNVPGGTANWTFTDATGNYNDATGTAGVVLDKAEATITVAGYTGTYDGNAHGATGSAKGVKNENLAGLSLGSSFTNVPGGTANWTFTDATGNYNDATGTAGVVLDKAEATITVAGYTGTYDGNAHGATGSAKGVKNENLAGLSLGSSFTNVPGGTANWTFTDATGNYNDATGTAGVVLDKAEATITVAGYTGTYDGNAHGATGSAKGVKNENLAGLSLGSSFTNVPGGTANWTFTDATGNYNDATGTAGVVLDKAEATITVAGYTGTYDGNAHGATGSAKGVKNENLAGLSLGSSFTNVPGGTANWTFTDATGNYNDATGTAGVVLDKAEATITVAGYTGTYDGNAHGATGSAKGVKNENLAGLSLGSSFTNVPGGTANWTFTDATGNYNDATGTAGVTIGKRPIAITADANQSKVYGSTDPTFAYTSSEVLQAGNSFTGALSRVAGETVTGGPYAYSLGSLSAGSNYSLSLNAGTFEITPKAVTVNATVKTKTYGNTDPALTFVSVPAVGTVLPNGQAISFTGALNRITGENVGNYAIGQNTVNNSNYTITYYSADLSITPLAVTVNATANTKIYGNADPALTFVSNPTVGSTRPNGEAISFTGALSRVTGENVGNYAIGQNTLANSNYTITYNTANFAITQGGGAITSVRDNNPTQYSDMVNVWARIAPNPNNALVVAGLQQGGSVTFSIKKGATGTPVLLGTSTQFTWDAANNRVEFAGNFKVNSAPDTYVIIADYTPANSNLNGCTNEAETLVVTKEDATVVYTGLEYIAAQNVTTASATANIDFVALVTDAADNSRGKISNAIISFQALNDAGNSIMNNLSLPSTIEKRVTLVQVSDETVGIARTGFMPATLSKTDLGNGGLTFEVRAQTVDNYYDGSNFAKTNSPITTASSSAFNEKTLVTIALPGQDFVTGGGHMVVTNSIGQFNAAVASKVNFGFTMKWNKSGKNIQGQSNILFRRLESITQNGVTVNVVKTYKIKSNVTHSMVTQNVTGGRRADIVLGANLIDITDESNPLTIVSGADLTIQAFESTDLTKPSEIAITLYGKSNDLLFSSHWANNTTGRKALGNGNIRILNNTPPTARIAAPTPAPAQPIAAQFDSYPNPFSKAATFRFALEREQKYELAVYDIRGILIKKVSAGSAEAGKLYEFNLDGQYLSYGVYFARLITQDGVKTIRIVKE